MIKKKGKEKGIARFKFNELANNKQTEETKKNTYPESQIVGQLLHSIDVLKLNMQNEKLAKSINLKSRRRERPITKTKVAVNNTYAEQTNINGAMLKGIKRLTDEDLKSLAQSDPHISAIIATRSGQGSVVGYESESKFDKGSRVKDLNPPKREDYNTDDEFNYAVEVREKQKRFIMNWALNCGTDDEATIRSAYSDVTDPVIFKKCSLSDYVSAQMRNLLIFGRMGSQKFLDTQNDTIQFFRPVPIETIYHWNKEDNPWLDGNNELTSEESAEDAAKWESLPISERPDSYIQTVQGRNVNFFTEKDLKISYLQKQTDFDLVGYPLAPIEQAVYMVFIHMNTLQYFKDQFIKGLGTKGILNISAREAGADLSDEDLDALRKEFHNFLTRTDNMSTTPVISGPVEVNWIPLSGTPKDMEFLHTEEHVIRALCSAFQISPQEMGYGHLGLTSPGFNSQNKQNDIIHGEERGLRLALDVIYGHINEIMYEAFPQTKGQFAIVYTGVGEDTRDAVINRGIQELYTTATPNSLWADSEKKEAFGDGGDIPLSQAIHASVFRFMRYGEFMERYFGKKGWAEDPRFDFIIDPNLNQAYQDMKMFSDEEREMQGELQIRTQAEQLKGMQMQNEMMGTQMGMMQEQQQAGEQPQEEPVEKSEDLSSVFERLKKSKKFLSEVEEMFTKTTTIKM